MSFGSAGAAAAPPSGEAEPLAHAARRIRSAAGRVRRIGASGRVLGRSDHTLLSDALSGDSASPRLVVEIGDREPAEDPPRVLGKVEDAELESVQLPRPVVDPDR